MSLPVQRCRACRQLFFPDRLSCSRCGGREFLVDTVVYGRVEETTALADGNVLASLISDEDLPLVARLLGTVADGDVVPLTDDPTVAGPAAFVPLTPTRKEIP